MPIEIPINGDIFAPAMTIIEQSEADAYFEKLVAHCAEKLGVSLEGAETNIRDNLGYKAGYYDAATRERVERLFKCEHPYFGKISEKGSPSPEEALRIGIEAGRKWRAEK